MARRRLSAIVLATLLAVLLWMPERVAAQVAPTCQGRDLLPELYSTAAGARARVEATAGNVPNGEAVLWRVSRDGVKPSYLFGTIHLTDDRVTKLSDAVSRALDGSKRVALEVADISPRAFAAAIGGMQDRLVFLDGRSVLGLLDAAESETMKTSLGAIGILPEAQAQLRPWFITMMLALTDCERRRQAAGLQPLDVRIAARARERSALVLGLESLEDQLGMMTSIPEDDQIKVLKAMLKTYAQTPDAIESMVQRYLARETAKIFPMQSELLRAAGFDPAIMNSFRHALLTVRNPRMRDAALPILAQGEAFIAVGALHLIGDDGLVSLLRQADYDVTPVE